MTRWLCDIGISGGSGFGEAAIVSNRTSGVFEAWGTDSAGNSFCCSYQGPLCGVDLVGGDGADYLEFNSSGYDLVKVAGHSLCPALSATINGGDGGDAIYGSDATTGYQEVLVQNAGGGKMHGNAGDDVIHGGEMSDGISGGAGNDIIYGNGGDDDICGDYSCFGVDSSTGDDVIYGGSGNDTIEGWLGADEVRGGSGDDTLCGGGSADQLYAGDGVDILYGGGSMADYHDGFGVGADSCYEVGSTYLCESTFGYPAAPPECKD